MDGDKPSSLEDFVIRPTEPLFRSNAEPIDIFKNPAAWEALYEVARAGEEAARNASLRPVYSFTPEYID